jgi:uncharacterized membrane protein YeaQ/YmgE (transglycosylase-associated protein family)
VIESAYSKIPFLAKRAALIGICAPILASCGDGSDGAIADGIAGTVGAAVDNKVVGTLLTTASQQKLFTNISTKISKDLDAKDQKKLSETTTNVAKTGKAKSFKTNGGDKIEAKPVGKAYVIPATASTNKKQCRFVIQKMTKKNGDIVEDKIENCDEITA